MTKNQKAIELLREFANLNSTGFRGVVHMKRLQKDALELLAKVDKAKQPKTRTAKGWLADELRKFNGEVVDATGLNEMFQQISLNNMTKVLPYFSWHDLREWAVKGKWIEQLEGPGVRLRIDVPPPSVRKKT